MSEERVTRLENLRVEMDSRREQLLLGESDALYREIFEHSPLSIWIEDWSKVKTMIARLARRGVTDWRRYFKRRPDQVIKAADVIDVIDVSAATLTIYRAERKEDVVGLTRGEEMSAGEREAFREQLVAFAEGATRFAIVAEERALDGSEIVTRIQTVIPPAHHDSWSRVLYAIEDITERKKVDAALRESEERFRRIFQEGPLGMAIVGRDYRLLAVNERLCQMVGYTKDELTALSFPDITHPKDIDKDLMLTDKVFRGEIPYYTLEKRYLKKNNEVLWINLTASVVRDQQGIPEYGLGMIEDITERKQRDEALRESEARAAKAEERLLDAIESLPEAFALFDADDRLAVYNKNYQSMYPTSAHLKAIPGARFEDIIRVSAEGGMHVEAIGREEEWVRERIERHRNPRGAMEQHLSDGRWLLVTERRTGDGGIVGFRMDITERKRAEEAFRRLSRHNELILRSAGEGIYGLDLEGRTTFVNPAAARMIGWEPAELIGQRQHEILHHSRPDGSPYPREDCPIHAAFEDGAVHHVASEVFWRRDGTSFPVEYVSTPILEDDALVGAVVVFRDITERARAEEALRESERRLVEAQHIAKLGHWVWDEIEDRQLYCSEEGDRLFGVPYGTTCRSFDEFLAMIHPDDRERAETVMERAYEDKAEYDVKFRIVRPDGEIRHVHEIARPELNAAGELVRSMGTVQDITERTRAEEALRQSERQLVEAQRIARLGHWGWDVIGNRHLYCSDERNRIFGMPYGTTCPSFNDFLAMVHPDDRERVDGLITRAHEDKAEYDVTYRIVRPDGEIRHVHEIARPELNEAGELARTIGTIQDITEQTRAEHEARQLSRLAALGTIVAGVAHELAQPLNVISVEAETAIMAFEMGRAIDTSYWYETLKVIHSQSARAGAIIAHLRDFSRTGPGDTEDVDLAATVRNAVDLCQNQLDLDDVGLVVDAPAACRTVEGNAFELEQVLVNLLNNARDAIVERRRSLGPGAAGPSGEIRVDVEDDAQRPNILVRVSDDAGGVPEDALDRIFDPFFTTKDGTDAIGLGLAICERSIVNMGGRIRARNLGNGAQFEIDLPAKTGA